MTATTGCGAAAWRSARTARRVVTGSDDGTARVWDAATGTALVSLHGARRAAVYERGVQPGRARGSSPAARRQDGAGVGRGHRARRWSTLHGPRRAAVTRVAFSPDGTRVVTASATTRRRGCGTRPPAQALREPDGPRRTACTPWRSARTGRAIVTGSRTTTARVWDAATRPRRCATADGHDGLRCTRRRSARTGRAIVTGSRRQDGAGVGRGHRPALVDLHGPRRARCTPRRSARTARGWLTGSRRQDGAGVGRGHRQVAGSTLTGHDGSVTRGGVQPGRHPHRDHQRRPDGAGVGRGHRPGPVDLDRSHQRGGGWGVQSGRVPDSDHQRRSDGADLQDAANGYPDGLATATTTRR